MANKQITKQEEVEMIIELEDLIMEYISKWEKKNNKLVMYNFTVDRIKLDKSNTK